MPGARAWMPGGPAPAVPAVPAVREFWVTGCGRQMAPMVRSRRLQNPACIAAAGKHAACRATHTRASLLLGPAGVMVCMQGMMQLTVLHSLHTPTAGTSGR